MNYQESAMPAVDQKYAIRTADLNVYYGKFRAVRDINLGIEKQKLRR
jgi:ABC-type phosphate transport system ATPase subunit